MLSTSGVQTDLRLSEDTESLSELPYIAGLLGVQTDSKLSKHISVGLQVVWTDLKLRDTSNILHTSGSNGFETLETH